METLSSFDRPGDLFRPDDPVSAPLREAVGAAIADFLARQRPRLAEIGAEVATLAELASAFTSGGKRLRPAFALWSYVAAAGIPGGPVDATALIRAAASLDVLHVSALVHDDVMDASDTRRGVPAAHRQLETLHLQQGWLGAANDFGRSGAILLGDLLVMWSVEMLERAGLDAATLQRARPIMEAMRTEVTCGQYLDVYAQHQTTEDPERALDEINRVVEYKSARYTVRRPCQFGAALSDAPPELIDALAGFGSPLGRAFQFRDDVLGVFGDAEVTGKPAGDDLREGKRTVLVAHTYAGSDAAARRRMDALLGNPELSLQGVDEAREIITDAGAREKVEAMIDQGLEQALAALEAASMTDEGRRALTALAYACVRRDF